MGKMSTTRHLTEKLETYQRYVREREQSLSSPLALSFTNDFDQALAFRSELTEMIPDLNDVLHVREIDAMIDYIYDKTCEDLRKKGFLSEESRQVLGR